MSSVNMNELVGTHDVLLLTLDTLRFDVAEQALAQGRTPGFAALLPGGVWERRHTPGSFTYPAHQAFLSGFLPTPARPGRHPRLFAPRFPGSETTNENTFVMEAPTIPEGLAGAGYHTVCIGGVGFFNPETPLGRVIPGLFGEAHWSVETSVVGRDSAAVAVDTAIASLDRLDDATRVFMLLNVAALHQPNNLWTEGAPEDSPATQLDALAYVDRHVPRLVARFGQRAPLLAIITSDHGTCYGEDGYTSHGHAHPIVWTVPYMEATFPKAPTS